MFNPNGSRLKLKWPEAVEKAVYFFASGSSGIWWKPDLRSRVEKYLALPNWSSMSLILGRGNLSAKIFLFNWRKSTTNLHFLLLSSDFFFGTSNIRLCMKILRVL